MSLVSNCDSLEYWSAGFGTLELDLFNKQEGAASIKLTGNGTNDWAFARYNPPDILDFSGKTWLSLSIDPDVRRETRIYIIDVNGSLARWELGMPITGWTDPVIDLDAPSSGAFDKSQVDSIAVYYGLVKALVSINIDNIRVGPALPTHSLSISSPMGTVPFSINGVGRNTPFSETLEEGVYTIEMPPKITVGVDTYNFLEWNDGDTSPSKTINLIADTNLVSNYEFYVIPSYQLTINSNPTGITFTIKEIGMSDVTPWTGLLEEGVYEVEMPSNVIIVADTYNFTQWEDGSTNPIRTINLISDMALSSEYELVIPPPTVGYIQVHAFVDSVEVAADGLIVETGFTFVTPATIQADPGRYTVRLTAGAVTKDYVVDVVDGQTIRLDGQLTPPIPPRVSGLLLPAAGLAYILLKGKRNTRRG